MKKFVLLTVSLLVACFMLQAHRLAIVHTNDLHSQIDPADNGMGGAARRMAVIDSIRQAEPHVVVIDAGDAVQGTMYFTIYKGEVEYRLLDEMGYDIAVLGNHDFDNGVEALAANLQKSSASWISANYDFAPETGLKDVFAPAIIKEFDGRKVGFFGINLDPKGMVAEGNYDGVSYRDATAVADSMARDLRARGADYVVAVTHIGYDGSNGASDTSIAASTSGIDLIIGSHSHSLIQPQNTTEGRFHWKHVNAAGDTMAVVQTGSRGANVGLTKINLDNGHIDYELIPVDSRIDSVASPAIAEIVEGYRSRVDSIMNIEVGTTARALGKADAGLMNFLGDFIAFRGAQLAGRPVDISLINAGGVRRELPEGNISKGMLIDMLPFNNRVVVLEINGAYLLEAIDKVIARGGNDGINAATSVTFDPLTHSCVEARIEGAKIDPQRVYTMATIDYLANGGDYMTPLTRAPQTHRSQNVLYDDLIEYVSTQWEGTPIDAPAERRIVPVEQ